MGGGKVALLDLVGVRGRVRVWVGVRGGVQVKVRVRADEKSPFLTWWGLGFRVRVRVRAWAEESPFLTWWGLG